LLSNTENTSITAIGSSYTNKNTGYPDALRYALQRNLLDISIPVDQGPWVGMEAYLRDDSFKTNPPKLIIWEIPERELRSPPNYKFRDARYVIENDEWLSRITNLLQ
jgi:alginate O-acetyltransferase complex protein AlgJ